MDDPLGLVKPLWVGKLVWTFETEDIHIMRLNETEEEFDARRGST